jgi:hypothetical protein
MTKKLSRAEKIRRYLRDNPTAKTQDIANHFKTRYQNVYSVRRKMDLVKMAKEDNWKTLGISISDTPIEKLIPTKPYTPMQIEMFESKSDPVNHPAHYKTGGIETIDFIEAKELSYHLGNVVKYVTRADHKGNKLEDLRKAQWYLTRAIETAK